MALDELVEKVKELQKTDPEAKDQWNHFSDMTSGRKRDPSKHTEDVLRSFITQFQSGARMQSPEETAAGSVTEAIKHLQKKSKPFKEFWGMFCVQCGGGRYDPSKHEQIYLATFVEKLAEQAALVTGQVAPGMGGDAVTGEAAAKRHMGAGGPAGANYKKDRFVMQINHFQRLGSTQRELWSLYADTYLAGDKDPSSHDEDTLELFCVNHNVPLPGAVPAPLPGAAAGEDMDEEKEALVERVKVFQKASRENAEVWLHHCGKTKDPKRHEKASLAAFCDMYGA